MSQRVMPKIETIVIAVFCFAVVMWAWSKCSAKKAELASRRADEEEVDQPRQRRDTVRVVQPQPVVVQQPVPVQPQTVGGYPVQRPGSAQGQPAPQQAAPQGGQQASQPVQNQAQPRPPQTVVESRTTLYSTVDGLKVRSEPGVKGKSVDKLKLYEDVTFLNQKTDWEEELSLAYNLPAVKDHWVKIRTKRGREGWVFGAGVHYYKVKAGEKR